MSHVPFYLCRFSPFVYNSLAKRPQHHGLDTTGHTLFLHDTLCKFALSRSNSITNQYPNQCPSTGLHKSRKSSTRATTNTIFIIHTSALFKGRSVTLNAWHGNHGMHTLILYAKLFLNYHPDDDGSLYKTSRIQCHFPQSPLVPCPIRPTVLTVHFRSHEEA